MEEIIVSKLRKMIEMVSEMADLIFQGLMENDADYLNRALTKEQIIDDMEKNITALVIQMTRSAGEARQKELVLWVQTAQNIERMGDELRALCERIEIKVTEGLYFSEIGINQYVEVFKTMSASVKYIDAFLTEETAQVIGDILKNGDKIKALIEKYRTEHLMRLAKGICGAQAANLYFDMLDFTGNIARHCTNTARIHKEK